MLRSRSVAVAITVVYFGLLLSPNLFLIAQWDDVWVGASLTLAPALALVGVVLALCGRAWVAVALTLPFALAWPVEIYYVVQFRAPIDAQVLGTIVETNLGEASAYVSGLGWLIGGAYLLVVGLWAGSVIACRHARLRWSGRGRAWALLATAGSLGVVAFKVMAEPAPVDTAADVPRNINVPALFANLEPGFPLGLPIRIWDYYEARRQMVVLRADDRQVPFGATQSQPVEGRQTYVLVIGETGRRDRWQLNGYARATTPRLAATPGVVWLPDVISPWSYTRMSVPVMLTRKSATDRSFGTSERSLISAFREAGFRTYWLSTQAPMGRHDSPIAALAQEADEIAFLNPSHYEVRGHFDDIILPVLERVLARPEPRQLIVIHTRGSHDPYGARYPAEFARFRPIADSPDDESLHRPEDAERLANSYDNSVLYTDWVLAEIIARLSATGGTSALLYAADHGEILFDKGCPIGGHGSAGRLNFEIAALAWHSTAYADAFPDKARALHENGRRRLSTGNLFASMLGMAGIRFGGDDPSFDLFSDRLNDHRRIVNALVPVDYDHKELRGACEYVVPVTAAAQ